MNALHAPRSQALLARSFGLVVTAALLTGCCSAGRGPSPVIVPEAVFRTESTIADRIRLPLTPQGRGTITNFIRSGGNWKNQGGDPTIDMTQEMGSLMPVLEYLTTHTLAPTEVKTNGAAVLTAYFGKSYTSQILDSRNYDQRNVYKEAPDDAPWSRYPPWPLALRHGRFWWVFFPDDNGKQCTGLMLTAEISRPKPKD